MTEIGQQTVNAQSSPRSEGLVRMWTSEGRSLRDWDVRADCGEVIYFHFGFYPTWPPFHLRHFRSPSRSSHHFAAASLLERVSTHPFPAAVESPPVRFSSPLVFPGY